MNVENESPKSIVESFGAPILKGGRAGTAQSPDRYKARILRPSEYRALYDAAPKEVHKIRLDALLLTGMRYVEAQRFQVKPEWFSGRFISLPFEANLKGKRTQLERWVRLSIRGLEVIPQFLKSKKLPSWSGWQHDLENWSKIAGLDPVGLSAKTTRKTWESWLMSVYPERANEIFLNQGHNSMTALRHYLNLPFLEEDKAAMRPWTDGMY